MTAAIRVSGLGKRYHVSHAAGPRAKYRTLRESLVDAAKAPIRRFRDTAGPQSEEFWALKDVDFEVKPGEVVGIIGHNGAGKSTLLKILSRITKPTTGVVEVTGRVGSLLEVGTGFHPELTGRENIYLNGSILGMSRRDIKRRFDEIVEFAGVEQFLDLPVKRYSSGMYVRLAFSVSAHLDSQVLLVDEVLAVGDASFQKKCLDKMASISRDGRTILFVSHNLSSIRNLCANALTLGAGRVLGFGPSEDQVGSYLSGLAQNSAVPLANREDREGTGHVRLTDIRFEDADGNPVTNAFPGEALRISIAYRASQSGKPPVVALSCFNSEGVKIFHSDNLITGHELEPLMSVGKYTCFLPEMPLAPGRYYFNAMIAVDHIVADHVFSAASLDVLPGDFYGIGRATPAHGGLVFIANDWRPTATC